MIFDVAEVVRYLSRFMVLEPGDIINTGTPAGVALGLPGQALPARGRRRGAGDRRPRAPAADGGTGMVSETNRPAPCVRHRREGGDAYRIASMETHDIRFPTSLELDGSDAMNPDPDYSAAYVVLQTDDGHEGHGFAFTIGRGNELQHRRDRGAASRTWSARGRSSDLGAFCAGLVHDSPAALARPGEGRHAHGDRPPWSTRSGTCRPSGRASRSGGCWPRCRPRRSSTLVDFRYLTDALTPERGARHPARRRARQARADRAPAGARATRPTPPPPAGSATPTTSCAACAKEAVADGLHPDQAEGRRRPGGRPAADAARPRGGAARTSASRSTPTSAGTSARRSTG